MAAAGRDERKEVEDVEAAEDVDVEEEKERERGIGLSSAGIFFLPALDRNAPTFEIIDCGVFPFHSFLLPTLLGLSCFETKL